MVLISNLDSEPLFLMLTFIYYTLWHTLHYLYTFYQDQALETFFTSTLNHKSMRAPNFVQG